MTFSKKEDLLSAFKTGTPFSLWLDSFRWLAALAVVFTHVNSRFFVKILEVPHAQRTVEQYAFTALSGFGRPAVLVFFVLSGFLVGGGTLRKYIKANTFEPIEYLVSRLSRLWVVLIPSFLLTYAVNMIGVYIFDGVEAGIYPMPGLGSTSLHEPTIAICNAFFLQTALCKQYGENGALWSLFNEFWYYMLWPLGMFAYFSRQKAISRVAAAAFVALSLATLSHLQFVGDDIGAYFLVWLFGVIAAYARKSLQSPSTAGIVFVVYLLLWRALLPTAYADAHPLIQFITDVVMAMLFANVLVSMKLSTRLPPPPLGTLNKRLAGFSFSLYCIHTPIINAYCAALLHVFGVGWKMIPTGPLPYMLAFTAVGLAVASAYLFSLLTEKHTFAIRNFVMRQFRLSRSDPV